MATIPLGLAVHRPLLAKTRLDPHPVLHRGPDPPNRCRGQRDAFSLWGGLESVVYPLSFGDNNAASIGAGGSPQGDPRRGPAGRAGQATGAKS